jgi:hypothetical protein
MASKIEMINSGLVLVGDKPLNSLTEDRRAAVVANQLYDDIFEAEITKHRWGFARTVVELNQLATSPTVDAYRYAYQLPADYLTAVRVWPNHHDYKQYGNQLWTNQPKVELDYIRKVTEAELPAYFVRLMTYALARDMSVSIRDEVDRFEAMDIRYKEEGRNARFQDSQSYPQDPIQDAPTTVVRF